MNEKPVVTSVHEMIEFAKRAGFTFPQLVHRSEVYPVSPEQWAAFQEKLRSFNAVDSPVPEWLRPHIEEPPPPPKWGEPLNPITVRRLGQG